jgi:multisubunit Na+/H+ antiporter MnhF subunit
MSGMNVWLWAAAAMLIALIPAGIVCFRGPVEDRVVGLEFTSVIVTLELVLLAQGFSRSPFYDLPLTLAFLSFGSGLVFARYVQRWL